MAKHLEAGKKGEQIAVAWLKQHGFAVLYTNWRFSHYEIDVIASKDDVLHFIEVKTRHSLSFGHPEEAVSDRKMGCLMHAAEEFLEQNPHWERVQYDILAITAITPGQPEVLLIEDVFY